MKSSGLGRPRVLSGCLFTGGIVALALGLATPEASAAPLPLHQAGSRAPDQREPEGTLELTCDTTILAGPETHFDWTSGSQCLRQLVGTVEIRRAPRDLRSVKRSGAPEGNPVAFKAGAAAPAVGSSGSGTVRALPTSTIRATDRVPPRAPLPILAGVRRASPRAVLPPSGPRAPPPALA